MRQNGGDAILSALDNLASRGGVQSVTARFKAMSATGRGYEFMERAGVSASARQQRAWLTGEAQPNKRNAAAIDKAYASWRRSNMAGRLVKQLNNGGRGTRVEVHPVGAGKASQQRDNIGVRQWNITDWQSIVDAWESGDPYAAQDAWQDAAMDAGSDGRAYFQVSSVAIMG